MPFQKEKYCPPEPIRVSVKFSDGQTIEIEGNQPPAIVMEMIQGMRELNDYPTQAASLSATIGPVEDQ
jgi:hypothetical protein